MGTGKQYDEEFKKQAIKLRENTRIVFLPTSFILIRWRTSCTPQQTLCWFRLGLSHVV